MLLNQEIIALIINTASFNVTEYFSYSSCNDNKQQQVMQNRQTDRQLS
jgi:hypothetical protein